MKDKTAQFNKIAIFLSLAIMNALGLAPQVRAGLPYPTASTAGQLGADINYANTTGGTFTINLQPNVTFTNGSLGIGGVKTVNLRIIGNGDSFDGANQSSLFAVNPGSSLNLQELKLQNGYVYANYGGAIYNRGMLTISNCTLTGNTSVDRSDYLSSLRGVGGAICNNGGTVIMDSTILCHNLSTGANPMGGALYNAFGTVTISNCTFTNNSAIDTLLGIEIDPDYPQSGEGGALCNESGTVTISHSSFTGNFAAFKGGGICNGFVYYSSGTMTVKNSSNISGNTLDDVQNSGTFYLDGTSTIDVFDGYSAIGVNPVLNINSWSSATHRLVISWSTNYQGYTLQSSTNLGSMSWTNCASPTVSGASFIVTNSMSAGAQFFRLRK